MIEGKHFIYLNNWKTGSSFIEHYLKKYFSRSIVCSKASINKISLVESKDKILISSFRNPYKIYVSLWAYGCMHRGTLHKKLTNKNLNSRFSYDFTKQFIKSRKNIFFLPYYRINKPKEWENLYSNQESIKNFNNWLYKINSDKYFFSTKLDSPIRFSNGSKIGFLSRRILKKHFNYTLDYRGRVVYESIKPKVDKWILTDTPETMKISLEKIMGEIKLLEEDCETSCIVPLKKINKSHHLDYNSYYNDKSMALIRENDSFCFELYEKIKESF